MREGLRTATDNKVAVDETCVCGARFSVEAEGTQAIGMARLNHSEWKKAHFNHAAAPRLVNPGEPVSITFDPESLATLAEALGPYLRAVIEQPAVRFNVGYAGKDKKWMTGEMVQTVQSGQTVEVVSPPLSPFPPTPAASSSSRVTWSPPDPLVAKREVDEAREAALSELRGKLEGYRRRSKGSGWTPK